MKASDQKISKRQRVINAITWQSNDYAPHNLHLMQEMRAKLIAYMSDPQYMDKVDNHIVVEDMMEEIVEIRPGFFRDEFGVVWNRTGADKDIGVVDRDLIADIEKLDEYIFPPVDEAAIRAKLARLAASEGERFRVADLGFTLFERAWTLCGMENTLCWMIEEPALMHRLLQKIHERNMIVIRIAMEYDIDAFQLGDDWGQQQGLIMGPTHWRAFMKPYVAEEYACIRDHGKFVIQHSCGDLREIMDELIEMGLNVYQTFQPEIYGLDYAQKLENRLTIWGGISTQADLPYKTPEEIKEVTRKTLAAFAKGGLIAAPTHDVPADVPPENLVAMLEVLRNS